MIILFSIFIMILNKLEFALLFSKILTNLSLHLDINIISLIYDEYSKTYYDKYTIFELLSLCDSTNIYLGCFLNKKSIINYIKTHNKYIPDNNSNDILHQTIWDVHEISYMSYTSYYNMFMTKNIIWIKNINTDIILSENDVYRMNDVDLKIERILEKEIQFVNTSVPYYDTIIYPIQDFIKYADNHDEFRIQKNNFREGNISLNFHFALMQIKKHNNKLEINGSCS